MEVFLKEEGKQGDSNANFYELVQHVENILL
jgi:hypothetical protein